MIGRQPDPPNNSVNAGLAVSLNPQVYRCLSGCLVSYGQNSELTGLLVKDVVYTPLSETTETGL